MPAQKGTVWITDSEFHLVGEDGLHWYYVGTDAGAAPADADLGSIWVNTNLYYIDANARIRYIPSVVMSAVQGVAGSAWINNRFLYWLDNTKTIRYGHSDVAGYNDYGDSRAHGDTAFYDRAHTDSYGTYTNWAHSDTPHSDNAHGDWQPYCDVTGCSPTHGDYGHGDSPHSDNPHVDSPAQYFDIPHGDTPHSDTPPYSDYGDSRAHADYPRQGTTIA